MHASQGSGKELTWPVPDNPSPPKHDLSDTRPKQAANNIALTSMDPELTYMSAARLNFVAHNVPDVNFADLPEDERNCPICMKPYVQEEPRKPYSEREEESAGMLHCGHVVGQYCLEEWIIGERKNTCPLCRTVIYEGSTESEDESEDDASESGDLHFGEFRVDFGGTMGHLSEDDGESGEEEIRGDGHDEGGRVGRERAEGAVARDVEAEEESMDFGPRDESGDEGYGQWPEEGEEKEYTTLVAGLEKGQRTIDHYYRPLSYPTVEAK